MQTTIKFSHNSVLPDILHEHIRVMSSVTRFAYNRYMDGMNEKQIRALAKELFQTGIFEKKSWMVQCAIKEAYGMYVVDRNRNKEREANGFSPIKRIFGGKYNLRRRQKGLISNEEWKELHRLPLALGGEAPQKGNRHAVIINDGVIIKLDKDNHVFIKWPKLHKNFKKKLAKLALLSKECKLPFHVKIDKENVYITYDTEALQTPKKPEFVSRFAGIDLNPNYIGLSICDRSHTLFYKLYNLSDLTKNDGFSNDKLRHETAEIANDIISQCKHWGVDLVSMEVLNIKSNDKNKGVKFNRNCNNVWQRNLAKNIVEKRCSEEGIHFRNVSPFYTSVIGNMLNMSIPDPCAAAQEIARRGYEFNFERNKQYYPAYIPTQVHLSRLWKNATSGWVYTTWQELLVLKKNSKLRYRVPIPNRDRFVDYCCNKSKVGVLTSRHKISHITTI